MFRQKIYSEFSLAAKVKLFLRHHTNAYCEKNGAAEKLRHFPGPLM
jgi:hypothetical protein